MKDRDGRPKVRWRTTRHRNVTCSSTRSAAPVGVVVGVVAPVFRMSNALVVVVGGVLTVTVAVVVGVVTVSRGVAGMEVAAAVAEMADTLVGIVDGVVDDVLASVEHGPVTTGSRATTAALTAAIPAFPHAACTNVAGCTAVKKLAAAIEGLAKLTITRWVVRWKGRASSLATI